MVPKTKANASGGRHYQSYPVSNNLELVPASHQFLVFGVEKVVTAHKVQILIPARVRPLHG